MYATSTLTRIAMAMSTALVVFSGNATGADDLVVKIGHVAPMTGPSAHLGKDNDNAATMAIEELNAKGVTIGGRHAKFVLLSEDDASDPKQGTAVAQKLVDAGVNGVIGHLNSSTSNVAAKIYSDAGIPQISPASTSPVLTSMGYKTAFRVVANDSQLGGALGRYAIQKMNAKIIAVIDDRSAYGQGVADEFVKGVKSKSQTVKFAVRQYTNDKATDFNAILTAIKSSKPDVVFFGGMDSVAGPMLRQMKALGITAKMIGGDGICTSKLPELAGTAMSDGLVICAEAGGVTPAQKPAANAFHAAYRKRFGSDVVLYAPYVYDAVMTMADAMQQAKSAEPAVYMPYLAKIDHKGVTGEIQFDKKGDLRDGMLTLFTYKAGQREQLEVLK